METGEATSPPFASGSSNSDMESDAIRMAAILLGILVLCGIFGLCYHFCGKVKKEGPQYSRVPVLEGVDIHDSNSGSNDDNEWDWDDDDDDVGQIEPQGCVPSVSVGGVKTIDEPMMQQKGQLEKELFPAASRPGKSVATEALSDTIPDDLFTTLGMSAEPAFTSRDAFSSNLQAANSLESTGAAWNDGLDGLDGL